MNATELPLYRCHKQVRAARIQAVTSITGPTSAVVEDSGERLTIQAEVGLSLHLDTGHYVQVEPKLYARSRPQVGWYYVVYADGYPSLSPGDVFEDGYALIDHKAEQDQALAALAAERASEAAEAGL